MNKKRQKLSRDRQREQLITRELKKRHKMLRENVGKVDEAIPSDEIIHAIRKAGLWPWLTEGQVMEAVIAYTNHTVHSEIDEAYFELLY